MAIRKRPHADLVHGDVHGDIGKVHADVGKVHVDLGKPHADMVHADIKLPHGDVFGGEGGYHADVGHWDEGSGHSDAPHHDLHGDMPHWDHSDDAKRDPGIEESNPWVRLVLEQRATIDYLNAAIARLDARINEVHATVMRARGVKDVDIKKITSAAKRRR